jgi:hypothetical protein
LEGRKRQAEIKVREVQREEIREEILKGLKSQQLRFLATTSIVAKQDLVFLDLLMEQKSQYKKLIEKEKEAYSNIIEFLEKDRYLKQSLLKIGNLALGGEKDRGDLEKEIDNLIAYISKKADSFKNPYLYTLQAHLSLAIGQDDRALKILYEGREAFSQKPREISALNLLNIHLYIWRALRLKYKFPGTSGIEHLENALEAIDVEGKDSILPGVIKSYPDGHKVGAFTIEDFRERFKKATAVLKNNIAYGYALLEMQEEIAGKYAEAALRINENDPKYQDTTGYVKLVFARKRLHEFFSSYEDRKLLKSRIDQARKHFNLAIYWENQKLRPDSRIIGLYEDHKKMAEDELDRL